MYLFTFKFVYFENLFLYKYSRVFCFQNEAYYNNYSSEITIFHWEQSWIITKTFKLMKGEHSNAHKAYEGVPGVWPVLLGKYLIEKKKKWREINNNNSITSG